ncbi:TonB-dependent receptor [Parasediminibacterium sp. JCM 36343]|uniref:TonB-dependent receptor n=1 Tax=Parasediminibacterium sp. JCM 36343 TaxID=3374279 RepID=UPI00397E1F82
MKQLLGTLAVTLTCLFSIAQKTQKTSVSGQVIDWATQKPVPSASLQLGNTIAIADENGQFKFIKLAKGHYVIVASSVGYMESVETIDIPTNNTIVIKLKSSPLFLQALEVKSLRASDKSPFTKTNLGKNQLAKTNLGQDLPFMLNQTPSTVIASDAGNGVGYTRVSIRGVDAQRTNVTINGIPYNDAEDQGVYFVDMPDFTSSLNSIQIQRGVGTSSNGTGAFGAGINLQTNEFNEKAYAEINNSYGSFNTIKNTVKVGSGLINNHFTFDARLSRVVSDGYIDRAASNLQSFAISAAYINKSTSIRLNIFSGTEKTYQAWYGVAQDSLATHRTDNPEGAKSNGTFYPNQTDNYLQNQYQLFFNTALSKRLSFSTAFFFTPGKGYYEEYDNSGYYASYGLPNHIIGTDTITQSDFVRQKWLNNKFYGQIGSLQYKTEKDQIILGGGWSRYEGGHYGNVIWAQNGGVEKDYQWYNNQALKGDANIYAKWEHQLTNQLQFYADAQYKYVFHRMNGFDSDPTRLVSKEFNFFNPKLGISYNHKGWQVYASYAVANKEPNRTDFENAIAGNDPKPERLNDLELGVEKKNHTYAYGATFYYMNYKDQLVLTGKLDDVGLAIRSNTPNSHRAGIELQGSIIINNWLNASGNITLSSNKIKAFTEHIYSYDDNYNVVGDSVVQHSNTNISFSPNKIAAATINILPCKHLELSLLSKYVGRQYMDNTQNKDRSLGDYYTQDIRAIITLKGKIIKECNLIAQVNNVLNRLYEPNGATYPAVYSGYYTNGNYYFPMAGTNYMVGLNIKL